jgi:hypothetical protein
MVFSSAPTIAGLRRIPIVADIARNVHVTSRPDLIRRFVLMNVGDPCVELRRAESERILRAQPFLADASVLAFADDAGGVELEVRTIDEASIVAGARMGGGFPFVRSFRLGSSNVNGDGIYLAGDWRSGGSYRDGFGVKAVDYQVAGRPYILSIEARRHSLGSDWRTEAAHPFLTDIQRIAWRSRAGHSDGYVEFEPVEGERHGLRLQRRFFDVGGIIRVGPPGRLSLFGASVSGDNEEPGTDPVLIGDTQLFPDFSPELRGRYTTHRIARVNALWGVRDLSFVRVRGFDALTGAQDLPIGFQLGTLFGRSLSVLGSRDDDVFMAADLYVGAGGPRGALRIQLQGEGRRSNDLDAWDGVLTSGRAAQYYRLSEGNTLIFSTEWSGGWRQRVPFRLTLGASEGGLRGFRQSTALGAQRGIVRLEDRFVVARPFGLGDLGLALFGDAGRIWAGDVPFGVTTPIRASVGTSILAAVPMRSGRLWRLDLAFPLNRDHGRRVEFRLSSADHTTFFWREPADIEGTRERTVPSSIFSWP